MARCVGRDVRGCRDVLRRLRLRDPDGPSDQSVGDGPGRQTVTRPSILPQYWNDKALLIPRAALRLSRLSKSLSLDARNGFSRRNRRDERVHPETEFARAPGKSRILIRHPGSGDRQRCSGGVGRVGAGGRQVFGSAVATSHRSGGRALGATWRASGHSYPVRRRLYPDRHSANPVDRCRSGGSIVPVRLSSDANGGKPDWRLGADPSALRVYPERSVGRGRSPGPPGFSPRSLPLGCPTSRSRCSTAWA